MLQALETLCSWLAKDCCPIAVIATANNTVWRSQLPDYLAARWNWR